MNAETQNALTTTTDNPVAIADGWDAKQTTAPQAR